jgi:toxin ParE1/3/4
VAVRPFRFNPAAEAELVEAAAWYEARRAGLAGEFVRAFRARIDGILEAPDRWPLSAGVRRALLGKFPYTIVYRTIEDGGVEVVAVAHVKRRPKYWSGR